ncbi:hypothetical protein J2Z50_000268 [Ensifer mexicanus]|nr:hypothetical protein [Sinorhizobium mexicanum]
MALALFSMTMFFTMSVAAIHALRNEARVRNEQDRWFNL